MLCSDASPYVKFFDDRCTACSVCTKACPTAAIRVHEGGGIHLVDSCIGCGECIRVCPAGAIEADSFKFEDIRQNGQIPVALVSPALYPQFPGVMPELVQQGLMNLGFQDVVDLTRFMRLFQNAAEGFIMSNRKTQKNPWPLISPVCPVVVRLIAFRFPSLFPNILPIVRPFTLMLRDVYEHLQEKYAKTSAQVVLYFILPCPTKMSEKKQSPYLEMVLGINDIYASLYKEINHIKAIDLSLLNRKSFGNYASKDSMFWGITGGEIAHMDIVQSLAVSGLKETMSYLEKIEMGLLHDIEYVEMRACPEGCVGGTLTAIDKYLAKNAVQKSLILSGLPSIIYPAVSRISYDDPSFASDIHPDRLIHYFGGNKKPMSLNNLEKIENIMTMIHGKNCSFCGAPDCRAFAEDVVSGRASMEDCIIIQSRRSKK